MNKDEFKQYVCADMYRQYGEFPHKKMIIKTLLGMDSTGSKYILLMRLCNFLLHNNRKIAFKITFFILNKYKIKYGIQIEPITEIGYGLTIPHCGGIVIHGNAKIGNNCTILQGTTIGANLFKDRYKVATIGDNVLIGAGSKIIGPITIGDNVTIGANSVVTTNIPSGVVIAGNPAKVISFKEAIAINHEYIKDKRFKLI